MFFPACVLSDIPDAATALFQNPVIPRTVKLQPRLLIRSMSCYCNMPTPVAAMPMAVAVRCRPKLGSKQGAVMAHLDLVPMKISGSKGLLKWLYHVMPAFQRHVSTMFLLLQLHFRQNSREGSTPWETCVSVSKMFQFWPHSMAHQMSFLDYCNYPVCSKKSIVILK